MLPNTTFLEPATSDAGVSSITTSALEPAREARDVGAAETSNAGPLPNTIDQFADAPPVPVRLAAAASVETDVPPEMPVVEVATPPMNEVTAKDTDEREPAVTAPPKVRSARKRPNPARAYRSPMQQSSRAKPGKPADPQLAQRAPRWAQQMFVTPWQSQAFSYTR
jgi:hypothetical protein